MLESGRGIAGRPRCREAFINFCIFMAVIVMLVGPIVCIYLLARPEGPKFWVESSAVASSLSSTRSELTATWNLTLHGITPEHNKDRICFYEQVQASLFYGDMKDMDDRVMLATKSLPALSPNCIDAKNKQTSLSFKLQIVRAHLSSSTAKDILEGKARLGLKLLGFWGFGENSFYLRLYCDRVVTGNLTGRSSECKDDNTNNQLYY